MFKRITLIGAALIATLAWATFVRAADVEIRGVIRLGNGRIIIGDWPRYDDYRRDTRRGRDNDRYSPYLYDGRRIIVPGEDVTIIRRWYSGTYPYDYYFRAPAPGGHFRQHYNYGQPFRTPGTTRLYRTDEFGRTSTYEAPWPRDENHGPYFVKPDKPGKNDHGPGSGHGGHHGD